MTTTEKYARLEAVEKELDEVRELMKTTSGFSENWKRFHDLAHEWSVLNDQIQEAIYGWEA